MGKYAPDSMRRWSEMLTRQANTRIGTNSFHSLLIGVFLPLKFLVFIPYDMSVANDAFKYYVSYLM